MTTICFGQDVDRVCPIRDDCFRFTTPTPGRDRFIFPFDFAKGKCELFLTNVPTEEFIRTSAYFLWIRLGRPEGASEMIWQQAKADAYAAMGRASTL